MDFYQIDKHVRTTSDSIEEDIVTLCNYLVFPAKNDLEKIRSIYQWIIWNIDYDIVAYKNGNKRVNRSNEDILERRRAICWGYSTLFKEMCEQVEISCEVISGYSKVSIFDQPKLEVPNHAWNSVKIDAQWYLLDATWGSGSVGAKSDFEKEFDYDYFLTPPVYFVINHLPANPNWQLLDCPISTKNYQLSPDSIVTIANREDCENNNQEGIIESFSIHDKRLTTAIKAFEYNPTEANKRELAHAHIDHEAHLSEIAGRLQQEQKIDSLLLIQLEMIRLCETAAQLTDLYTGQLENCAYNYFNYPVTLTQVTTQGNKQALQKWQTILAYFEKAQAHIIDLQQNIFTKNALLQCNDYIEYAKTQVKELK